MTTHRRREEALGALRRLEARVREAAASRGSRPDRGDLFVADQVARSDVHWLVLAVEGARVCVVPVDEEESLGCGDVLVAVEGELLVARLGLLRWTQASALRAWTGRLDDVVPTDGTRCGDARRTDPASRRETDACASYQAHRAALEAMLRTLPP